VRPSIVRPGALRRFGPGRSWRGRAGPGASSDPLSMPRGLARPLRLARRYGIQPARVEWMAAAQPADRQPAAVRGAMHLDGLQRVGAAGRVEAAARAEQRADEAPVPCQQVQEQHGNRRRPACRPPISPARYRHCGAPPCRRVSFRITRSSSAASSAWREVAARGLARTTSRLPPGSDGRYPRAR
jgi:hypothetical protein